MRRFFLVVGLALALLTAIPGHANIRLVPGQYATIQAAIDAAAAGDTVLVAPGSYFENIKFKGKKILVASQYVLTGEVALIRATIIDGSKPAHPDTASCVLFINREDSSSVLAGFTLTGGRGTLWRDEHGAGDYWEGGGVLSALASPTIRNNFIFDNEAINGERAASAGGGAIRCGDGAPRILNNVILANRGMYGAGMVLNYCSGAIVRNNVIAENRVYQAAAGKPTYGGGGIWINNILPNVRVANIIENNTIIGNSSASAPNSPPPAANGGAFVIWNGAIAIVRNNIVWANTQTTGGPIYAPTGSLTITHNNIEGGYAGTGNIAAPPQFADSSYYLNAQSPCVDGGDPGSDFNDPADSGAPAQAKWPSRGSVRNDMGAYGGPGANILAAFSRASSLTPPARVDFGNILPGNVGTVGIAFTNIGAKVLRIEQAQVAGNAGNTITIATALPLQVRPAASDTLKLQWAPLQNGVLQDTLLLYSNDASQSNPQKISLWGNANPTPQLFLNTASYNLGDIDVNVARADTAFWIYNRGTGADSVYLSINYRGIQPAEALSVSPGAAALAAGDSLHVTFALFPALFRRPLFAVYSPRVVVRSRFGLGTTVFEKEMRFRLVGTVGVDENAHVTNGVFKLEQNQPNPFNPQTKISFTLPQAEQVSLKVYDMLGNEVATLKNEEMPPGAHALMYDARALSSGTYFYRLQAGAIVATKKMSLVR